MYDVIVVGARCAGGSIALLLGRRGYRVLVVDRDELPSDMPMSTHFIHARGVACLGRWGLRAALEATGSPPISRYDIDVGPFALSGSPPPVDGEARSFAPRRILLDDLVLRAAEKSGVEVRARSLVEELVVEDGRVTGIRAQSDGSRFTETARLVIGADGPSSRVAAAVGAEEYQQKPALQGTAWIYWQGQLTEGLELHLRDFEAVYAFPVSGSGTLVGVNWGIDRFKAARRDVETNYFEVVRRAAPKLAERIAGAVRADQRIYLGSTMPTMKPCSVAREPATRPAA